MTHVVLLLHLIGCSWAFKALTDLNKCHFKSVEYKKNESVIVDSCNTCTCLVPEFFCTLSNSCSQDRQVCVYDSKIYKDGSQLPKVDCNECACRNGWSVCTLMTCVE